MVVVAVAVVHSPRIMQESYGKLWQDFKYKLAPTCQDLCFYLRIVSFQNLIKHKIYTHKDDGIIRTSNFTFTYTQDVLVSATETATRCCYHNALVIFKGLCYYLLFSTTKSLFDI